MISGFVISGSLDNRGLNTFTEFVSYFYSRRIKRIMPALIACVVVSASAYVLLSIPGEQQSSVVRDTALSSLFGFSNFILYGSDQGYFAQSSELNPFTHTWSLGVEEQFYLLFPFLFFWWAKDNSTAVQRRISAALFIAGLIGSAIIAYSTSSNTDGFSFYMLPARFWELACGVLIYQLHASQYGERILGNLLFRAVAPISVILVACGFVLADKKSFPIPWALLPVLGTAGILASLLHPGRSYIADPIKLALASKPMVYIGQRSYSMYLWHWPVLVMFRWTIGLEEPAFKVLACLLTLALTIGSYNLVERPIRSSEFLRAKSNRFALLGGLTITLLILATTAVTFRAQKRVSLSVTAKNVLWYPKNRAVIDEAPCGSVSTFLPFTQSDSTKEYRKLATQCSSGPQHDVFVLGDSHAWHYLPIYNTLAASRPLDVNLFSDGGCRFPESIVFPDKFSTDCQELGRISKKEVLALAKPGDVLFLPGSRVPRLTSSPATSQKGVIPIDRMRAELQPFLDLGMEVVLEAAKPLFPAKANQCADWFNKLNPTCKTGLTASKALVQERAAQFTSIYATLTAEHDNIHLWQPLNILCPETTCSAMVNKMPLFFDENHLSWHGNRVLYPEFEAKIDSLISTQH